MSIELTYVLRLNGAVTKDIAGQLVKKWKRLVGVPASGQAAAAASVKKREESPVIAVKTESTGAR